MKQKSTHILRLYDYILGEPKDKVCFSIEILTEMKNIREMFCKLVFNGDVVLP